ncbi:MAG: GH32 C-terminal domain-containing protein, partial [Planctomycetota bacterium]|nr:GH32 C-terminal domain-containing protein [Planctomycetota bacterium]
MFARPVRELDILGDKIRSQNGFEVTGVYPLLDRANRPQGGDLVDAVCHLNVGNAKTVGLTVHGAPLTYDVATQELSIHGVKAPLPISNGVLHLRVLVDRGSIEVFANEGAVAIS